MKQIKLIEINQISVKIEPSIYCDFCGTSETNIFTSSFDDRVDGDDRKCEMQICFDCVKQLAKIVVARQVK